MRATSNLIRLGKLHAPAPDLLEHAFRPVAQHKFAGLRGARLAAWAQRIGRAGRFPPPATKETRGKWSGARVQFDLPAWRSSSTCILRRNCVGRRAEGTSCSRGGAPARGARPPGRQPPPLVSGPLVIGGPTAWSGNGATSWSRARMSMFFRSSPCSGTHKRFASRPSSNGRSSAGARPKASPPKVPIRSSANPHTPFRPFPCLPPSTRQPAAPVVPLTSREKGGRPQGTGKEKDEQDGGGGPRRCTAARCVTSPPTRAPLDGVRRPFAGRLARTAAQACRASRAPAAFARGPLALEHGVAGEPRMQPTSSRI